MTGVSMKTLDLCLGRGPWGRGAEVLLEQRRWLQEEGGSVWSSVTLQW